MEGHPPRVLVVDATPDARLDLARLLEACGARVLPAGSGEEALEVLGGQEVDAVLTDHLLPGMSGLDLLAAVGERRPEVPVILTNSLPTLPAVVQAIRAGAVDYLHKPVDPEALRAALEAAAVPPARRAVRTAPRIEESDPAPRLVGASACIRNVKELVRAAARTASPVLLHGPSGTGKELLAESIHALSPRAGGPFVAVNCAALPEGLAEGELFGAERGAYTGADAPRTGLLRAADHGTLFLDEVGEMPSALQAKLLRALQQRAVRRVGGTREEPVDVRVIAATNRDPEEALAQGRLREDLYYRLAVVKIAVEPLRRRVEDVAPVAEALLARLRERYGGGPRELAPAALRALELHPWPGNVRELENVLDLVFAMDLDRERVELSHLPEELRARVADTPEPPREAPPPASPAPEPEEPVLTLRETERRMIRRALDRAEGNKARAARLLGVSRPYLYRRLGELELAPRESEPEA